MVSQVAFPMSTTSDRRAKKGTIVEEDAFKKISALENELAHLRAQIAAIVTVQGAKSGYQSSISEWFLIGPCLLLPSYVAF